MTFKISWSTASGGQSYSGWWVGELVMDHVPEVGETVHPIMRGRGVFGGQVRKEDTVWSASDARAYPASSWEVMA